MKKKLPIGISDFKKIIDGNYYYFDKTELIKSIIGEPGEVKLFTRPRRFGKTLNMSMIKYFFDIENKDGNKKLFENLKISENEYFEKQGTAPVISISFRNYDESSWGNGFEMIKNTISDLYDEFEFVKENLSARKKEKYDSILFNRATEATWKLSLLDLTKYLYEYYGKKVVVLIWPVIKALPTLKLIRMANTTILSEHIYKLKIQHALKEKIRTLDRVK